MSASRPQGRVDTALLLGAPLRETVMLVKRPEDFVYEFGKSGASNQMAVDGSITPVVFKYTAPAGVLTVLARMIIHIQGAGGNPGDYAGIAGGLTNGLLFQAYDTDGTSLVDFTGGESIKKNSDYAHMAGVDVRVATGGGTHEIIVRATIVKAGAALALTPGQYIAATVQDDLRAIIDHNVIFHGLEHPLV